MSTRRATAQGRVYDNRPDCATRHHNTVGAYRMGCRCPEAVEAKRVRDKRRRQGRPDIARLDATGTRRRLGALMVAGWRADDIAAAANIDVDTVRSVARGERRWVYTVTAQTVRELCHRWAGTTGPSPIAAKRARAAGHVSLAAWDNIDDPAAVPYADLDPTGADRSVNADLDIELVVGGRAPFQTLVTRDDKAVAIVRMAARGMTRNQIAKACHLSWESVAGYLKHAEQTREAVAA